MSDGPSIDGRHAPEVRTPTSASAGSPAGSLGTVTLGTSFPLVVLVLAVGAVVAIAANGLRLLAPAASLGGGAVWVVRLLGVAAVAIGASWLLVLRRQPSVDGEKGRGPAAMAIRTAATIMGLLTLAALVNPPPPTPHEGGGLGFGLGLIGLPSFGGGGSGGATMDANTIGGDSQVRGRPLPDEEAPGPASPEEDSEPGIARRLVGLLPSMLLLLMAVMALRAMTKRPRPPEDELILERPLDPVEAEAGLEASLAEVIAPGTDPRGQITYAYLRLLEALAAAGAPREPYEAPHEHLRRALAPLGVRSEALHRLAGLYVLAQFSERQITERHRAEAAAALEVSLAGLRSSGDAGSWGHGSVVTETGA